MSHWMLRQPETRNRVVQVILSDSIGGNVKTELALCTGTIDVAIAGEPRLSEAANDAALQSRATNTLKTYAAAWRVFARWCDQHGKPSLPAHPIDVANYLAARA